MLQVAGKIRQKFRLSALKSWFGRDRGVGLQLLLLLIGIRSSDPSAVQVLHFKTFDLYQNLQPRVVPDGDFHIVAAAASSLLILTRRA